MATADKLITVAENVPKVYHAGQMTVVENAKCLKRSKTDTAMLLDDVSPVEHTMGVKVHGKNLFDISQLKIGSNSKGLATTQTSFSFKNTYKSQTSCVECNIYLQVGTYYINGNVSLSDGLNGGWALSRGGTFLINNSSRGTVNGTITITEAREYIFSFYCNYNSEAGTTATYSNIQLELGTKATDYEPYNSDIQNVHSKNLIPYPYAETTKTENGITFTDNGNGTITVNGTTPSDHGASFQLTSNDISIKAGTYSTSGCVSGSNSSGDKILIMILAQDDDYNIYDLSDTGSNKTTTIVNDSHIFNLSIQIPPDITLNNAVFKPQLEYGKTATAYAKYHEPYPLVVSRYGKNLVTAQQVYSGCRDYQVVTIDDKTAVRFIDSKESKWKGIHFAPNTQYTVSFDFKVTPYSTTGTSTKSMLFSFFYDDNTTKPLVSDRTENWLHITGTSSANKTVVGLGIYSYNYVNYVYIDVNSFQLEEGTSETAYEPYITPTDYTPNTDGTVEGVESLYPSTTLLTNDPYGKVYIDCDYYKDIDKTFNELTTSVALSGGE